MQSLVTRVLVAAGVVLVIFLGLTIAALDLAFQNAAQRAIHDRLQVQVLALISAADADPEGGLELPAKLAEPRLQNPGSGLYAQILDHRGDVVWRSPSAVGVSLPVSVPSEFRPGSQVFGPGQTADGEDLFQYGFTVLWDAGDDDLMPPREYHFAVAETLAPFRAQLSRYRTSLFWWFGLLFASLVAAQLVILRRMLLPLRTLAAEVGEIEAGTRAAIGDRYPRELQRLARNLNAMIRNERGHLSRYRNTLGDLAHSLKTPLAVVRCALDERPSAERDATIAAQVERMSDIISFQLQRALAAGTETFGRVIAVAPEIDGIIASLRKVYAERGLSFETEVAPGTVFRGDRGALLELLGNLLDNACKWGRASVRVAAANDASGRLVVTVEDDGPGIPADARAAVLDRGIRGDESVAGQGIGLAVVSDIVAARGGTLELGDSVLSGLRVSLRL
ncbi:MAG: two-component sensor histidine kinase [Xanthomonadaceae bacterium]|nr:two-component sensor histidine kinase [Xanthomonadaceae bacterium]